MEAYLIGNYDLRKDIVETISYLTNHEYQVESYCVFKQLTKGIVFAHPEQLKKLQHHGWLTLIDMTGVFLLYTSVIAMDVRMPVHIFL